MLKHYEPRVICEFDWMIEDAARRIAPTLARNYSDENVSELMDLWYEAYEDCQEQYLEDMRAGKTGMYARDDIYYIHCLMEAFETYLTVAMENDF